MNTVPEQQTTPIPCLAPQILQAMEPHLARLREAVEKSGGCRLVNCGVIREGPEVFTAAISCEAFASGPDLSLSWFVSSAVAQPGAAQVVFTTYVAWTRSHERGGMMRPGLLIDEASAGPFRFTEKSDVQKLVRTFPRMEKAMQRALERGRPPSFWASWWGHLLGRSRMPVRLR